MVAGSRLPPRTFTGFDLPAFATFGGDRFPGTLPSLANSESPFDYLTLNGPPMNYPTFSKGDGVFDTWSALGTGTPTAWNNFSGTAPNPNMLPLAVRVKQLQITIRIFDPKTKQTRQNTLRTNQ